MDKIFDKLEKLFSKSANQFVELDGEYYEFNIVERISDDDLSLFEIRAGIELPSSYKNFLLNFGSVEIFATKNSSGITILSPDRVKLFSKSVFENYGDDLYPNLFLAVNLPSVGWFGGFDLTKNSKDNFALFFPEVPPKLWIEEADFVDFEEWLRLVISSNSNEVLL